MRGAMMLCCRPGLQASAGAAALAPGHLPESQLGAAGLTMKVHQATAPTSYCYNPGYDNEMTSESRIKSPRSHIAG